MNNTIPKSTLLMEFFRRSNQDSVLVSETDIVLLPVPQGTRKDPKLTQKFTSQNHAGEAPKILGNPTREYYHPGGHDFLPC